MKPKSLMQRAGQRIRDDLETTIAALFAACVVTAVLVLLAAVALFLRSLGQGGL